MLPEYPNKLDRLPRPLKFVRDLEAFEGPILSEYRAADGNGLYLEKWCAREAGVTRSLLVRTEERSVAEYLGGRITLLELLKQPSDGFGFLIDRVAGKTVAVYLTLLTELPPTYLPKPIAYHDEGLRPDWTFVPQSFLIDEAWNAHRLAYIERQYLNAAGFAFLTDPHHQRALPSFVFNYDYDGGYPVMHFLNAIRESVPQEERPRSVRVSASSPGVLTLDAPAQTADLLRATLKALPAAEPSYEAVNAWSRLRPTRAKDVPRGALSDIRRLSDLLNVDYRRLFQGQQLPAEPTKDALLVAGKLLAAYYRLLMRVLSPGEGIEFISVKVEPVPTKDDVGDDEDEEEELD